MPKVALCRARPSTTLLATDGSEATYVCVRSRYLFVNIVIVFLAFSRAAGSTTSGASLPEDEEKADVDDTLLLKKAGAVENDEVELMRMSIRERK